MLSENLTVAKRLNNIANAYPVVAPESAKYPYIVFTRTSTLANYHKLGVSSIAHTFDVVICSDRYAEALDIAKQVIEEFNDYQLDNAYEEYSEAYVYNLTITKTI
jgi:hypothetical protein